MIFLRLINPDTDTVYCEIPVISGASFSYGLNSSAQFSGNLPQNYPNVNLLEVGHTIELYSKETRLLRAIVQQISPSLDDLVQFTAVGEIDGLYSEKIFPLAYYESKPLLGILVELLNQVGWLIGDISSLADPDEIVSIDLRTEANLLTQINKLLSGSPETFYREGDEILGRPSLDLGSFLQDSGIQALMPSARSVLPEDSVNVQWIDDFSYQDSLSETVYALRGLGGNTKDSAGVNRAINLGDALSSNSNLMYDPDFPIIEDLAERNWFTLNYRDFGRVGGRVLSTVDGAGNSYVGDNAGAGVEENVWAVATFVPIPGILESFSLWFDAVSVNALGLDLTWILQEISPSDYRTVLATDLLTGTLSTTGIANTIQKIVPSTEYELVRGKLYGIAIGFNFNPVPDVATVRLKTRLTSTSYAFRFQRRNGLPGVGVQWNAINDLSYLEVVTRPIDSTLASFKAETANKYAPKNTGANSTLAQTQAAGLSLYNWTKAYLIDHKPDIRSFSLETSGAQRFPKAGDTIYVNSKARGQYINPLTRQLTPTLREVSGNLRIDKVQVDLSENSAKFSYDLLNGTGVLAVDSVTSIYDETESKEPADGDTAARPWALLLDTLSTTVGPASPNTSMEDGTLAYLVSLSIFSGSYPSRPNNIENVYLAGLPYGILTTGGELRVEMVQLPSIETPNVIFKIALKTRDWEYGDIANLTVKQVWR